MKAALPVLVLLLAAAAQAAPREEPHAFPRVETRPKPRVVKEEKKKPAPHAAEPKGGEAARLKALEQENQKLKQELAQKNGAAGAPGAESASPQGALDELKAGNARFVLGARTRSQMSYSDAALRQTLAKGQAPFAVIVTCSDSRLADNYIFDQELGRLFTIREAGNSPDTQSLASIEYALEHLGSKVVVVLGHESCGAVKAVMESGPKPLPGNLWSLQAAMAGLLDSLHHPASEPAAEHLSHLVEANTLRQARAVLDRSPLVQHLAAAGKVQVVPAVYDLASGKVKFHAPVSPDAPKAEAHH